MLFRSYHDILIDKLFEFKEDIESYYKRVIDNKPHYNTYDYQGGMNYENQSYQHPCEENHPA